MTNTLHNAAVTMLIALAFSAAPARAQLSVDRVITFGVPSDRLRAQVREIPEAREVAAGDFVMAGADLDGDGKPEAIVLERRPADCRNVRCGLLVMRGTTSGGTEVLLLTRVAVPLALTLEKVNGYRALVALGANGEIAVGDRRDAALAGKPLVYLMRIDPVARGPNPKITEAPAAASPAKAGSVRLEDIAAVLALPVGDNNAKIDWKAMEKLPGIRMGKDGDTERYSYRDSTLMLDSLGKADVTWTGISDFVVAAIVNTGKKVPPTQYTSMLQGQFSAARLKQLRGGCRGAAFGKDSAIYEVNLPQRQPLYLHLNSEPRERSGNTSIVVSQENSPRWAC